MAIGLKVIVNPLVAEKKKEVRAVEETIDKPKPMTVAQWGEHLDIIKKHSIVNEVDYASAWTAGRTVFAIQGEFFVRPLRFRSIPLVKMSLSQEKEFYQNPGTPFLVVHQVK